MKKKIGDLTLREVQKLCNDKPLILIHCETCPVYELCQCSFNYDDEELEIEIEVDENGKQEEDN